MREVRVSDPGPYASACALLGLLVLLAACDDGSREMPPEADDDQSADLAHQDAASQADLDAAETRIALDTSTDEPETTRPPSDAPGAAFVAHTGMAVPAYVPVDPTSGPAATRLLGPDRGRGFGLGEASLSTVLLPQDRGDTLVAVVQTFDRRQHLFALPLDGRAAPGAASPVELAVADDFRHEAAFSPDGGALVWADGLTVFVAPVDGSSPPTKLAVVPDSPTGTLYSEVRRLRWVEAAGRVVFEVDRSRSDGQISASVFSARLNGLDRDAPVAVTTPNSGQHRVQAVLPDGRLLISDKALSVVRADGSGAVRITPATSYTSLVGIVSDGLAVVVELRSSGVGTRDLVRVATDGSDADSPSLLLREDLGPYHLLSPNGRTVAVLVHRGAEDIVMEVAVDGATAPRQMGAALSSAWLLAWAPDGAAVVGCEGNDLVRVDRASGPTVPPTVLATSQGQSCGLTGLTGEGNWAAFIRQEPPGGAWTHWVVRVDGTTPPVPLDTEGGLLDALPGGIVWRRPTALSAVFLAPKLDASALEVLVPWTSGTIDESVNVGPWVVFHRDGPDAGWFGVDTRQGASSLHRAAASVTSGHVVAASGDRVLVEEAVGGVVRLASLRADFLEERVLLDPVDGPWTLAQDAGLLLAVRGPQGARTLEALPLNGDAPWLVRDLAGTGEVLGVTWSAATQEVVWLGMSSSYRAVAWSLPLRSTEPTEPFSLGELWGWPMAMAPVPGQGRVLVVLGTEDTAVPHPFAVASLSTSSGVPQDLLTMPGPVTLWAGDPTLDGLFGPDSGIARPISTTRDGAWIVAGAGDKLFRVHADGTEALQLFSGIPTPRPAGGGAWLAPDDRTVVGLGEGVLAASDLETGEWWTLGSLGEPAPWSVTTVLTDREAVAFLPIPEAQQPNRVAVIAFPLDGSATAGRELARVAEAGAPQLGPTGGVIAYPCGLADGHGLCAVVAAGSTDAHWVFAPTGDDAVEVLTGFLVP